MVCMLAAQMVGPWGEPEVAGKAEMTALRLAAKKVEKMVETKVVLMAGVLADLTAVLLVDKLAI